MKLSNNHKHIILVTLYSLACTLITNNIIQGFMLQNGIHESTVMLYLSVIQSTQVCVMLGFSLIVDKIKKIMQLYSVTILLQIIMFVALIIVCLTPNLRLNIKTVFLFSVGIVANINQAILSILQYKTPYYYVDMKRFGNISGLTSFFCGLSGALLSFIMIFVTAKFDYNYSMLGFFIFGIILIVTAFVITKRLKITEPQLPEKSAKKQKKNIFKYKPFYLLAVPHLIRGFNSGIFVTSLTIGFSLGITTESSSATMTLILQSAYMIGNFFFSRIAAPRRYARLAFVPGLCLMLFMPLMVSGNLIVFYIMYFLAALAISIIDSAVPCVIIELVDYEYIGQYSSYRMLLHTLGITISSLVVFPLINIFGGIGMMLFSASLQFIAGTAYLIFMRVATKKRQFGR